LLLYSSHLALGVSNWPVIYFINYTHHHCAINDHHRYMKQLLQLKQRGTEEEYQAQFEELSYQIAIKNPHYDEQFYVSQFIKGLKSELHAAVESQLPDTMERAILLAMEQQEVLAEAKSWAQR
jgi:hypothetical protein